MTFFYKFFYELYNVADTFGGFYPHVGIVYFKTAHFRVRFLYHFRRISRRGYPRFVGLRDDFIVYVGIISRVSNVVTLLFQIFSYNIVNYCLICVTYVRFARHRDAARVHFDFACL